MVLFTDHPSDKIAQGPLYFAGIFSVKFLGILSRCIVYLWSCYFKRITDVFQKDFSFFQLRVMPTAMSGGSGEGMGKESMTKEYCRGRFRGLEGKRKQDQDCRYSSCFLTFCLN